MKGHTGYEIENQKSEQLLKRKKKKKKNYIGERELKNSYNETAAIKPSSMVAMVAEKLFICI